MTALAAVKQPRKKRIPYFSATATVDVDIDPDDLHEAGWHYEDECGVKLGTGDPVPPGRLRLLPDGVEIGEAIESLHRQAHPSQHPSVAMCHEEPCRSLTLDQVRGKHYPAA